MTASLGVGRILVVTGAAIAFAAGAARGQAELFEYQGMCEASAAVAVGPDHFLVADDQDSILHLYKRGEAEAIDKLDLRSALGVPEGAKGKDRKTDIEGAAKSVDGNRVYWITGHSEKWRLQRRFFATDVTRQGEAWSFKLVGTPYRELRDDLLGDKVTIPYLNNLELRDSDAANGFNIEGLAATPDGQLLIGLRSPIVRGKALVARFENPDDVLFKGAQAKFKEIVPLSLDGNGIRSIDLVDTRYLIIAGSYKDVAGHSLYWWSGARKDKPVRIVRDVVTPGHKDFRPEALFAIPDTSQVQLLGDEGDVSTRPECKDKDIPKKDKKFRSLTIEVRP